MIKIGEKFARTELVIVPAQVYAVDYYVACYKCAHCEKETDESYILQAECPVQVMKKSMAAPATVAHRVGTAVNNDIGSTIFLKNIKVGCFARSLKSNIFAVGKYDTRRREVLGKTHALTNI